MPRALVRSLALSTCLALGLILAPIGCEKQQDMKALTVPSEGLALRYELVPGARYDGNVERRETISARDTRFVRTLKFTVELAVLSVEADGSARVAATVSNIVIDWNIPDMPISLDEFNANAKKLLEGVTIRFQVDPQGRVSDIPASPPNLDEATIGVLDSVIEGLTSAFYVLPSEPLTAGKTWDDTDTRGREGKLGKYVEETTHGALVGLFEDGESQQKLAQLQIEQDRSETTTTKSGTTSTRVRSTTSVLFDTEANYMARIDSSMNSTQGPNTTKVEFLATWKQASKGGGANAVTVDPDAPKVQNIADPCNDDYVGPEDCMDPCNSNYMGQEPCPSSPAPTPAPESAPESAPAGESSTTG